jgi:hypothetical protein
MWAATPSSAACRGKPPHPTTSKPARKDKGFFKRPKLFFIMESSPTRVATILGKQPRHSTKNGGTFNHNRKNLHGVFPCFWATTLFSNFNHSESFRGPWLKTKSV